MSTILMGSNGDWVLSKGQLAVTQSVAQCTVQKLNTRFQFYLGAWFLDLREGIPALDRIYVKNPHIGIINQLIARIISQTPGVAGVTSVSSTFNSTQRGLSSFAQVVGSDQSILTGGPGNPFIVTQNGKGQA